jgi:hypothetical protein
VSVTFSFSATGYRFAVHAPKSAMLLNKINCFVFIFKYLIQNAKGMVYIIK